MHFMSKKNQSSSTLLTRSFLTSSKIHSPSEILDVIELVREDLEEVSENTKYKTYNVPCSFDIETSSFYDSDGNKTAIMYEWSFCLDGLVIIGRTWDEFLQMLELMREELNISVMDRFVIYVHNLSFEFQFIRHLFHWNKMFALSSRKPIYAMTTTGFIFKCSYLLSGYSLSKLAENLTTVNIKKMVGDLDYKLIRHSKTPLTDEELGYCVNDVKIVVAYITEQIEKNGSIIKIPNTKTGYVRRYCRDNCFWDGEGFRYKSRKYQNYRLLMESLTLEPAEYQQLIRAFAGGFTHANPMYSNRLCYDIGSDDLTSSYPTVLVSERYPMSRGELVTITSQEQLFHNLKLYCCVFDIQFIGLEPRVYFDNYISQSKTWGGVNVIAQNGRVVSADSLYTTITDVDFTIIQKFYKWKSIRIGTFRRYRRGYLPTDFIKSVLQLYKDKTELKGVSGKESEYLNSKEQVNSAYGMIVTNILRPVVTYQREWGETLPDLEETIKKYNKARDRFLFYPWGVFVTAYARRNLISAILEFGDDYVYADTDSVKGMNRENHIKFYERYNQNIVNKLKKVCDFHGIPYEYISPKNKDGKECTLGLWDYEGTYSRFKTIGAKRYMTEKDGKISMTVSGLNKKVCIPYLLDKYGKDEIWNAFTNDLYVPAEYTGKNTHTYIDEQRDGVITDYLGNTAEYHEKSSVHLEESDYSLSLVRSYLDYIFNIQFSEEV